MPHSRNSDLPVPAPLQRNHARPTVTKLRVALLIVVRPELRIPEPELQMVIPVGLVFLLKYVQDHHQEPPPPIPGRAAHPPKPQGPEPEQPGRSGPPGP